MLFQGSQNAQIALNASGVVIADILLHHLNKDAFAGEASAVIAFPLQNAPETLCRYGTADAHSDSLEPLCRRF